jgi:hypothetical protein
MHRSLASRLVKLTLGALALISLSACESATARADAEARDRWTRSYPAAPGLQLELVNTNGAIRAEASDGASLELVAERSANAATDAKARALLADTEMREDVDGQRVRVEVISPATLGGADIEVSWTVRVPKGVSVDLETANGRIALAGLSDGVRAETVNGAIVGVALTTGRVSAETVNGAIELELATPPADDGRIALESVNGAVSLALPAESRASVSAEVVNGAIDAHELVLEMTDESSRTELVGTLNGGGARVTLETVNGAARITRSRAAEGSAPAPAREPERGEAAGA